MKCRILLLLFAACALVSQPAFAQPPAGQDYEINAILRMADAGMGDPVIVKHIRTRGFVFNLSADDLIELRRKGISDSVLEAMLDTVLDNGAVQPAPEPEPDRDDSNRSDTQVSVVMSAGWFSPWYYYPSAWGFYYDPFPVCYSYYYYPFRFCASWGYYGHCSNYYYRDYWGPHRRWWDDPAWYHDSVAHPGVRVRAPRTDVITWRTGRGVPSAGPRHAVTGSPPAAPHGKWLDAPIVRRAVERENVHARSQGSSGSSATSPRGSGREAPPAQAPRSQPPRDAAPAPAPRQHVAPPSRTAAPAPAPRQHMAPSRAAAPAPAPRSQVAPYRSASPAYAPRGGSAPHGGYAAPAPRSGGVSVAPRSGVGARSRLGP